MTKLLPEDVTVVPFEAGHATTDDEGEELPAFVEEEPPAETVEDVPTTEDEELEGIQLGSWNTVRRLPAPQNSAGAPAQVMLQSLDAVRLDPAAKALPQ